MPSQATSATACAATPHPLAGETAHQILASGGNAVDAAVAAMLTLSVVIQGSVGLGGYGGSLVVCLKDGSVAALNFDSHAPKAYRRELFAGKADAEVFGYLAISVPAVVAGLAEALRLWGTLSWAQASEHAIRIASEGFPVDATLKAQMETMAAGTDAVSRQAMFPQGRTPEVGEIFVQRDLANLLQSLADEGPESFYRGDLPSRLCTHIQQHGGILSAEDFDYQPELVQPLHAHYRGLDLFTPPLPSGGLTTLQILKALNHCDIQGLRGREADYFHLFAEVAKLCWQDREAHSADPNFREVPVAQILSDERAADIAEQISSCANAAEKPKEAPGSSHTGNVVVKDAAGNMVSLTATQGGMFGSRVVIPGLGLVMGHGMSRFDSNPASPNAAQPGKRMCHNMSPLLALQNGGAHIGLGMPGGETIVTVTAQMLMSLVDFQMQPLDAVCRARVHVQSAEPLQVWNVEGDIRSELRRKGHSLLIKESIGGPCNALAVHPETGQITAASQGEEGSAIGL